MILPQHWWTYRTQSINKKEVGERWPASPTSNNITIKNIGVTMFEYSITLFDNIHQRSGRTITMDVDKICQGLSTPIHTSIENKSQLPLWSPTTFDGTRSTKNAQSISMLVYDMDDGDSSFDVWCLFAQRGWTTIAHTSASHSPNHHKYRVIVPLASPLPKSDWDRVWRASFELWMDVVGIGVPDTKAIKDLARVYFRYGWTRDSKLEMMDGSKVWPQSHPCSPAQYHRSGYWIGRPLELKYDHIQLPKPKPRPKFDRTKSQTLDSAMMDPQLRERVGVNAGGRIVGDYIKHIQCPSCGRKSVFYSIDPSMGNSTKWPSCNRINKCGWWGKLETLS